MKHKLSKKTEEELISFIENISYWDKISLKKIKESFSAISNDIELQYYNSASLNYIFVLTVNLCGFSFTLTPAKTKTQYPVIVIKGKFNNRNDEEFDEDNTELVYDGNYFSFKGISKCHKISKLIKNLRSQLSTILFEEFNKKQKEKYNKVSSIFGFKKYSEKKLTEHVNKIFLNALKNDQANLNVQPYDYVISYNLEDLKVQIVYVDRTHNQLEVCLYDDYFLTVEFETLPEICDLAESLIKKEADRIKKEEKEWVNYQSKKLSDSLKNVYQENTQGNSRV